MFQEQYSIVVMSKMQFLSISFTTNFNAAETTRQRNGVKTVKHVICVVRSGCSYELAPVVVYVSPSRYLDLQASSGKIPLRQVMEETATAIALFTNTRDSCSVFSSFRNNPVHFDTQKQKRRGVRRNLTCQDLRVTHDGAMANDIIHPKQETHVKIGS